MPTTTVVDQKQFTEILSSGEVLVDFYTDHCPPCRQMLPILDEIAEENKSLTVVKRNAADNPQIAAAYRVSSVPTFILFKNGEMRKQLLGLRSKKEFLSWLCD